MTAPPMELPYETAQGTLYASDVVRTEWMGIDNARKVLGDRVKKARKEDLHTVMTRHGQPEGLVVDAWWYQAAREALGDPWDVQLPPKPKDDES